MRDLRIYADFNGLRSSTRTVRRLGVPLDTLGSLRGLTNAGLRLHEGARILVYDWSDDEEDLEGHATAYYDTSMRVWVAELDDRGVSYVPKGDRTLDQRFVCLGCRTDLAESVGDSDAAMPRVGMCDHCGTPMDSAIGPPDAGKLI